jgi:hypothetical protein
MASIYTLHSHLIGSVSLLGWTKRVSPLNSLFFFFFFFNKNWIGMGLKINPYPKAQNVTRFLMGLKTLPGKLNP